MQFWIAPLNYETPLRGRASTRMQGGPVEPFAMCAHGFLLSCVLRGGWCCWSQLMDGKTEVPWLRSLPASHMMKKLSVVGQPQVSGSDPPPTCSLLPPTFPRWSLPALQHPGQWGSSV